MPSAAYDRVIKDPKGKYALIIFLITAGKEGANDLSTVGPRMANALSVAWCESTGNPRAENRSEVTGCGTDTSRSAKARGAFQIVPRCHPAYNQEQLWDLKYNVAAAYDISKGWTDFGPWACTPSPSAAEAQLIADVVSLGGEPGGIAGIVDDLGDAVGGAAGAVGDVVSGVADAVTSPIDELLDTFRFLSDPGNWLRVTYVVAGFSLACVGLVLVGMDLLGTGG